ncbi:Hsp20/alpha crystallin family protein [Candidatus Phytoplasma pini]|uniref:Molecular chaperone n=1 Tax=Candidatus Phytoplasma pini TaxID=267362 RepID=A0A559KJ85_9MOLU|nr:Hsp20 family protein [Candidatus Phytoplasma pini]TVY12167.1 molecular chaperone [Candidatus Phytoplasma pini]
MNFNLIKSNQDLLEDLFEDFKSIPFSSGHYQNILKTDIKEYKNNYIFEIEIPGFKKEDVKISLEDGWLVVEVNRSNDIPENENNKPNYLKQERIKGMIRRSFNLGKEFNIKDVEGNLENGLLTIKINKKQKETKPKEYLSLN